MGYTHYVRQPNGLLADQFKAWSEDVAKLVAVSPVAIAGGDGYGKPTINENCVCLNGSGDDDSHETFQVTPDSSDFEFCKTARKPYDLIVTAALCSLKHHCDNLVDISSDGDAEDWGDGIAFCRKTLGYGKLPFSDEN